MLKYLEISDYRGFKSYRMDGLTNVNLLVGKNNSGKTALLEAAHLLTSTGSTDSLVDTAIRRGELGIRQTDNRSIDITHFFNGHIATLDSSFRIAGGNGHHPIKVSVVKIKAEDEQLRSRFAPGTYVKIIARKNENNATFLRLSPDGTVNVEMIHPRFRHQLRRGASATATRFVGTESLDAIEMAEMWDEITINGRELDIAESLKFIEPDIKSLHFLTGALSGNLSPGLYPARGGIVVGMHGLDTRIPLGSMGDGIRRLMALATSLSFTKNSYLFVDEIDTGLHFSIMREMWRMVVEKAKIAQTQVFATTHSWDCIEGLSQLCASNPEDMNLVSVHKIDKDIDHSISFSGDAVLSMVKSHIDPR